MNSLDNLNNFSSNTLDGLNLINETIADTSLLVDGTNTMLADIDVNSHIIKNLSNGLLNNDAVNFSQLSLKSDKTYVDTQLTLKGDLTYIDTKDNLRLKLDGTTSMTGDLNLNSHKITNLLNGSSSNDAVNYGQLILKADITNMNTALSLKMDKSGGGFTDAISITETTGTLATATKGTITLDHQDSGGGTSIVFKSKVNAGSDYGYIQYKDTTGTAGTEKSQLTIGVENDATGTVEDNINFKLAGVERFKIGGAGLLTASSFGIPFRCITGRLNNNSTVANLTSQTYDFASFTTTTDMILLTFSSGAGYVYCNITTGNGTDNGTADIRLIEMTSGTDVILKNYHIFFERDNNITASWETIMNTFNIPNNGTGISYFGHPPFILTKNRTFRFQITFSRNTDDQFVVKWTDCYTCFFPVDSPNYI